MPTRPVDTLLRLLDPRHRDGGLCLDLRTIDWMPPAAMVAVAAQAHRARQHDQQLTVLAPTSGEAANYAARMRLGHVLAGLGARHDFPGADRGPGDASAHLIEVTAIEGSTAVDRLARLVFDKLADTDRALAAALHGSVGEIAENVPDHARTVGFMAAQTLPRRNELLLAVGDAGVGMRATLARRGARTHEHAIELATREDVSRYDEPDRGRGLPRALRLVAGQRGSVYIASGTASIRHFPSTRRYLQTTHGYHGTIVEARIPLSAR
ncbi:hypothetical protein [uncultured Jatrophihabitans sp.]|uniref:hypothetical protein n=1 Tax=uncultured Jatrophihabitans sp. TaxID=1610747 RepID=UPI0035CBD857